MIRVVVIAVVLALLAGCSGEIIVRHQLEGRPDQPARQPAPSQPRDSPP